MFSVMVSIIISGSLFMSYSGPDSSPILALLYQFEIVLDVIFFQAQTIQETTINCVIWLTREETSSASRLSICQSIISSINWHYLHLKLQMIPASSGWVPAVVLDGKNISFLLESNNSQQWQDALSIRRQTFLILYPHMFVELGNILREEICHHPGPLVSPPIKNTG